jgi:hypothetical protein
LLQHTTTHNDGRFQLDAAAPEDHSLALTLRADGRSPVFRRLGGAHDLGNRELGDIPMVADTEVSGRVVDEQGLPVDGVELMLFGTQPGRSSRPTATTRSQADGAFRLPKPLASGGWELRANPPFRLRAPMCFDLFPGELQRSLRVELIGVADLTELSGRVQEEGGQPLSATTVFVARTLGATSRCGSATGRSCHPVRRSSE